MSPAAESLKAAARSGKHGGKKFEETFKPKSVAAAAREPDNPRGNKKKKSGMKALIIIMIIILLLGGAAAALHFTGNLNFILSMVGLVESTGPSIQEQQAALDHKEADLAAKEQELLELQAKLDKEKAALESAEPAPEESPTFESILSGFSEEKINELKQVGAIYTKMDPAAAAAIMLGIYDSYQIAVIVYHMQPAAAAILLAQLDPALAGEVTKIMTS